MTSILLLGALALSAQAEEFKLKNDETGKVHGPYAFESGSKVEVGESVFTIVRETSVAEKRLADMQIAELRFERASLEDAITFLTRQTREIDPEGVGVNFVIAKAPESAAPPANERGADSFGFGSSNPGKHKGGHVTLNLRSVSALQVLTSIMDTTGYSYKTTGNVVTIYPK